MWLCFHWNVFKYVVVLNAGQVGLGSSRPESSRPGSTRPVISAWSYIAYYIQL